MLPASSPALDFELLFAALPTPHAVLDADGNLLVLNQALAALLPPATAATLPGQPLTALRLALAISGLRLADAARWTSALLAVQQVSPQVLTPPPAIGKNTAQQPHWQATLRKVKNRSAKSAPADYYLLLQLLDVTEQLHAQHQATTFAADVRHHRDQLHRSEEELLIQTESIPQQIWTALPDGTVDYYNHRTAAYVGAPMEENGAAHWLEFVHPDDHAVMQERWQQAIATQRYYEAEFRLRRYDGQYRWFLGQAQARRQFDGPILKWYGTNTDIHQQRILTEGIVRREKQFRFLAESLPQIVWTSTGVGGNDYVNQRWFEYTGLNPVETGDRANWTAVIHPDDLIPTNQRWQHSVETGVFFEIEYRFRRHDGVYRWFLGQGQAQRHADGHILKWFGTCTDIDDQKQVQHLLREQNTRLIRTNQDLDNFVYTASHDLKQPINNMAGIFEELTRTAYFRDPDAIKLISYFERALGQIYHTIDALVTIVQVQRQEQSPLHELVPLLPLANAVIASVQDQITRLGATFELDFELCHTIPFGRVNLQSIFFNLISNALKYADPARAPHIRIVCAPDPATGRPVLTFQDNGLGLDLAHVRPRLFQQFSRFHPHIEGSGMGLYLVNRIVEQNGGRLEVESEVGVGSLFRLLL